MFKEILKELGLKDLSGFMIKEVTEIYQTNEEGSRVKSIGLFQNPTIAKAYGDMHNSHYFNTAPALLLTNGNDKNYHIVQITPATVFNDEKEALEIKAAILAKLSPEEREILGFN